MTSKSGKSNISEKSEKTKKKLPVELNTGSFFLQEMVQNYLCKMAETFRNKQSKGKEGEQNDGQAIYVPGD